MAFGLLSFSLLELLEGVINRKPSSRAQSLTTKMQAERDFNDIWSALSLPPLELLVLMLVRGVINIKSSSRAQSLTTKIQAEGGSKVPTIALIYCMQEISEKLMKQMQDRPQNNPFLSYQPIHTDTSKNNSQYLQKSQEKAKEIGSKKVPGTGPLTLCDSPGLWSMPGVV